MSDIYQGIILKVVPYKESDAIITLLTKNEGHISFKARGIFKINSKNASSLQLYTIGEYKLESKLDYSNKTLSSASTLFFPLYIYEDLKYSCIFNFIAELSYIYKDNYLEIYNILETMIKNLDKIDFLTAVLLVLKYVFKWNGVIFEVDSCVKCNKKQVDFFNYNEGGFLCNKCAKHIAHNISSLNYLKQIRIVMKANIENIFSYKIDEIIGYKIFIDLFKYLESNLGIYLKSKEMLLMCIKNTDSRLTE